MTTKMFLFLRYFLGILLGLYITVWAFSPLVFRYYINEYLVTHSLILSEGSSIRYNPITAHLDVDDLIIHKIDDVSDVMIKLDDLEFEARLYQFLLNEIYISELYFDGLFLHLKNGAAGFEIGGINISSEEEVSEDVTSKPPENIPYIIFLPELTLKNSELAIELEKKTHSIKFKQLAMNDVALSFNSQHIVLNIESEVDKANVQLDIQADIDDDVGKILVDLNVTKLDLAEFTPYLPKEHKKLQGNVSYEGHHLITYDQGDISLDLSGGKLQLESLGYNNELINIAAQKSLVSFDNIHANLDDKKNFSLDVKMQSNLQYFSASPMETEGVLGGFTALAIHDVVIGYDSNKADLSIKQIKFKNVKGSQTEVKDTPSLVSLESFTVNDINWQRQGLSEPTLGKSAAPSTINRNDVLKVKGVVLSGLKAHVHRDAHKKIINLVTLPEKKVEAKNTQSSEIKQNISKKKNVEKHLADDSSLDINIGNIYLSDSATLHVLDESVKPAFKRNITIEKFSVGPFDSQLPDKPAKLILSGKSDKYAGFSTEALLSPWAQEPIYDVSVIIKELTLPGVSPYIIDTLGYEIDSGQLDMNIKAIIKGDAINGDAELFLRGIDLEEYVEDDEFNQVELNQVIHKPEHSSNKEETKTASVKKESSVVPFDVALNMLKDSKGNVELSLPLKGNINNPDFGVTGFINLLVKQAVMLSAKNYLLATVVPYASIVNVAISAAGDYALKVTIKDLVYDTGQTKLSVKQNKFLETFTALMTEKPDLHVKVCGISVAKDINQQKITSKAQKKQLNELSAERAQLFKDYMVHENKIASSRILFCKHKVSKDEKSDPVLTFTF